MEDIQVPSYTRYKIHTLKSTTKLGRKQEKSNWQQFMKQVMSVAASPWWPAAKVLWTLHTNKDEAMTSPLHINTDEAMTLYKVGNRNKHLYLSINLQSEIRRSDTARKSVQNFYVSVISEGRVSLLWIPHYKLIFIKGLKTGFTLLMWPKFQDDI